MVELIVNVGLPLLLLVTGIVTNIMVNRNRARFLAVEEAKYRGRIELLNTKRFPDDLVCEKAVLVTGSVVVANNYFVAFASSWKNLFGGELRGYTKLCENARRIAIVRLLEDADRYGADKVYNLRIETAMIQGQQRKVAGGVELIAYGTAVVTGKQQVHEERISEHGI